MPLISITLDNFEEEVLKSDKLVFVSFTSDTCGPCKALKPTLTKFSEAHQDDVKVVEINSSKTPTLSREFGIMSIPVIVAMKDGKGLLRATPSTYAQLEEFLENAGKAAPCTDKPAQAQQKYVYKIDTLGQKALNWPPLHQAVLFASAQKCKEILAYAPDAIHEIDSLGRTAITYVSNRNTGDLLDVLIEAGADINQCRPKDGQSVLMFGAQLATPKILEEMLARGANLTQQDNNGKTALHYARESLTRAQDRVAAEQEKGNEENVRILTESLPRFVATIEFLEQKEAELKKAQPLTSVQRQPKL